MARIGPEIVEQMRQGIAPLDTPEMRDRYRSGNFPRADRVQDLDKRYRWDLFWAAPHLDALYDDRSILDSHIDTALRKIVPPLEE